MKVKFQYGLAGYTGKADGLYTATTGSQVEGIPLAK